MTKQTSNGLADLINNLSRQRDDHVPGSPGYERLKAQARQEVQRLFSSAESHSCPFGPFGEIIFPYHKMGAVDSLDLFGLDELILFSYYWANRQRYHRAVDIGANIGLHSVVMSRCGFTVRCYEPDPAHFQVLTANLEANHCDKVSPIRRAVSSRAGSAEFLRILGNTTSSHISGSKKNPYGPIEKFVVDLEAISALEGTADLFKIDAEGHEVEILSATGPGFWKKADAVLEVGTPENASAVFDHLDRMKARMFAQKIRWQQVRSLADVPTSHREGSLFITTKEEMPWT